MPIDYVAYNAAGARIAGMIEVESEEEAEQQLWASGLVVAELRRSDDEHPPSRYQRTMMRLAGAKTSDTIVFTRQLETLLRAGISIHQALRQLRSESRSISLRFALDRIIADVEDGERFSRAISKHPRIFPPFYLRMVPMAEETGDLPRILRDVTATMERQQRVASQARNAILTPAISLAVGFVAAFILFTFVLPRLVDLLSEFGTDLPRMTRILVAIASFSRVWAAAIVGGFIGAIVLVVLYVTQSAQGRRMWHIVLLRLPVIGPVVRSSTMFDVCSMLSLLLQAGVPPVAAIRAVTGTIGNIPIRDAFIRVDHEVTEGRRLGVSLQRYPVIPQLFSDTVANGEQAGALSQNLEALAE
ncbi:MAG: type II secretion system F family protein, partial [Dehalococcoidia bacterium]